MIDKLEDILNDTIIKSSGIKAFYLGNNSKEFLTIFASKISEEDLKRAYRALLASNSRSAISVYVILCTLAHIYVNDRHVDAFIAQDFGVFEKSFERFFQDEEFALMLLRSYLKFYSLSNRPSFTEYAKSLELYIGVEEKEKPKDEILTIDEVMMRAFHRAKLSLESLETDEEKAKMFVKFIHKGSAGADPETKEDLNTLRSSYTLFLRIVYAKIFACVLSGSLLLEDSFQREFDTHLMNKDYTASGDFEVNLVTNFLKALAREEDVILDEGRIKLVRGIFPLYR